MRKSTSRKKRWTFTDAMEVYIQWCQSHAQSPSTIINKRHCFRMFMKWAVANKIKYIDQMTLAVFEDYCTYLFNYKKLLGGGPLTVATRRLRLTAIRELYRRLYLMDMLDHHPLLNFELPRVPKPLPKEIFTVEEIEQIIQYACCYSNHGLRNAAMIEVFYATGIRTAELANLTINDIDLDRSLLMVSKGKGQKDRVLPIAPRTVKSIKAYLQDGRPKLAKLDSGNALFLTNWGHAYIPNKLSRLVSQLIQRSGVEKLGSCRKFRHASATLMLENGADTRVIQVMLGHVDISTTQIYTQVSPTILRNTFNENHPAARG